MEINIISFIKTVYDNFRLVIGWYTFRELFQHHIIFYFKVNLQTPYYPYVFFHLLSIFGFYANLHFEDPIIFLEEKYVGILFFIV